MTAHTRSPFWRLVEAHGGTVPDAVDAHLEKASGHEIAAAAAEVARAHLDAWLIELLGIDVAGLPPERIAQLIAGGFLDPSAPPLRFGGLDPWGAAMAIGQAVAEAGPDADAMRQWTLTRWEDVLPPPAPVEVAPAAPAGSSSSSGGPLIVAPPAGLGDVEREAWIQARQRGAEFARGLGNIVADDLQAKVVEVWDEAQVAVEVDREQRLGTRETIREATAEAVARAWSADRLASELANRTQDWGRNWKRIAVTELQGALNDAVVIQTLRLDGDDGRVARIPEANACEACRTLFLDADGKPRIFTVAELVANGTNVGKPRDEWRPTVWPAHPHCRCGTQRVPAGFEFNDAWEIVRAGA